MLFTSMEFLLLFFPVVYGVNFLLKPRYRNYWLFIASLFFYAWGEPVFVFAMIASIAINYLLALLIDRNRKKPGFARTILIIDIFCNLGLLFVFKYLNFVTANLRSLFPLIKNTITETSIVLPIGISFFTFQALSYVIDVYRGARPQKNPVSIGLYISLFPQLIAGPIVRYSTIAEEINRRQVTFSDFADGVMLFLRGFNKKILLANVLAEVADYTFSAGEKSVCLAWLGAVCYSLQIFFDFCGYSEMAMGLGRMLGFHFEKNFDYPYISKTITEFWRRWHITLGSWFRDYVYIPLGGSRVKTKGRLVLNLMTVWLLTGIWHGAEWTFILWGVLYGVIIITEKTILAPLIGGTQGKRIFQYFYQGLTMIAVVLGWVLFRAPNLSEAGQYIRDMIGVNGTPFADSIFLLYSREYAIPLLVGLLCATPFFRGMKRIMTEIFIRIKPIAELATWGIQLCLFVVSVSCLIMSAHNPFIYFNF